MGQMYSAVIDPDVASSQDISAEIDFFEILAPADATIKIHEIHIGQESEEGDAQAEMLSWGLVRGEGATAGSGGIASTEVAKEAGNAVSGATVLQMNTTKMTAGGGSIITTHIDAFHVAAGLNFVPTPDARPVISGGDRLTVELMEAPADNVTFAGVIVWEEIGG